MLKHLLAAAAVSVVPLALVACSDENDTSDGGDVYEVTTTVVSHETTQDIWVSAPEAEGPWPIIYALHGTGGTGDGLAETAGELARHGYVVFSPTWRTEMDAECSYRYALTIADQYGGDPDLGITGIGHSLGAGVLLIGGLDDAAYAAGGTYDDCFDGGPRRAVLVPIGGGDKECEDIEFAFDPGPFSGRAVDITLVVANEDPVCEPGHSPEATAKLECVGSDARLAEDDGGNHANDVYFEIVDGEWWTAPGDPIGEEVVEIILDAIEASQ